MLVCSGVKVLYLGPPAEGEDGVKIGLVVVAVVGERGEYAGGASVGMGWKTGLLLCDGAVLLKWAGAAEEEEGEDDE